MNEYRFTFGQKYPREPHPMFDKASRNGYVTVTANSYESARNIMVEHCGLYWAFQYDMTDPHNSSFDWSDYYLLGELARWSE